MEVLALGRYLSAMWGRLAFMGDPSGRMLRLLSLLQTHRFWPGAELAGRLAVSSRTLRRDVDRLRELGYLVEATRGVDGGYRLEAGADLPPLLLEDEEAVAIGIGLRAAASGPIGGIEDAALRALTKLEQVLPSRLRRRLNDLSVATVPLVTSGGPTIDWSVLTTIAQACRDVVRIEFDYVARDGAATSRVVEPHRLVSAGRRWYLVAWDVDRRDWRSFRVDRLASPPMLLTSFNPRALPGGDAAAFVAAGIESMVSRIEAIVVVDCPADDARTTAAYFGASVEVVDAERCRVSLAGEGIEWIAVCLGMFGHDFDVEAPPELAAYIGELGERFMRSAPSSRETRTAPAPASGSSPPEVP